jgi:hypothetical protein
MQCRIISAMLLLRVLFPQENVDLSPSLSLSLSTGCRLQFRMNRQIHAPIRSTFVKGYLSIVVDRGCLLQCVQLGRFLFRF